MPRVTHNLDSSVSRFKRDGLWVIRIITGN